MSEPVSRPPSKGSWQLLRRADQLGVAVLVLSGLAATAAWWIGQGGLHGRLLEVERTAPQTALFRVNLNTAEWSELAQIPGLGEVLARRIVEYRTAHGPWQDVRDLQKVRGIGPKIFAAIRPYLVLAAPAHAPVGGH